MSGFYDAGLLERTALNLFHGWGYNFYRVENQLRADDQLVRSHAAELLAAAAADISIAEDAWRRDHLKPPTRANPFADPDAVAAAASLERLARDIGALHARIAALPTPENDRMTQRYRREAPTLAALIGHDQMLIGQAALLRDRVAARDAAVLLADLPGLQEGLAALTTTLQQRSGLLAV